MIFCLWYHFSYLFTNFTIFSFPHNKILSRCSCKTHQMKFQCTLLIAVSHCMLRKSFLLFYFCLTVLFCFLFFMSLFFDIENFECQSENYDEEASIGGEIGSLCCTAANTAICASRLICLLTAEPSSQNREWPLRSCKCRILGRSTDSCPTWL